MILERGITGFFDVGVCPLVENDYTAFKQACYSIQTKTTNLLNIYKPDNANYFYAHFNSNGQNFYVLLNKYHPIVAFTKELTFMNKTFIDISEKPVYLMNYDIVCAEILNSPFNDTKHNLSKVELEQIKYWNPTSIGNIIFNEWD